MTKKLSARQKRLNARLREAWRKGRNLGHEETQQWFARALDTARSQEKVGHLMREDALRRELDDFARTEFDRGFGHGQASTQATIFLLKEQIRSLKMALPSYEPTAEEQGLVPSLPH